MIFPRKARDYFWVILITSLVTFGVAKFYEFSSVTYIFESEVGRSPLERIVRIEDLSAEPGAAYHTYRVSYYLPDFSKPLTTVTYVSRYPLLNIEIVSETASRFEIRSDGKVVVKYDHGKWFLLGGLFDRL